MQEKGFQLHCIELFSILVKRESVLYKTRCIFVYQTYIDKRSKIQGSVSEAACSPDLFGAAGPTSSNTQPGLVHEFYLSNVVEKYA